MDIKIGKTIGSYVVEKFLGKGQYGEVFLVKSTKDGLYYAIKCIKKSVGSANEGDRLQQQTQESSPVGGGHHEQDKPPQRHAPL